MPGYVHVCAECGQEMVVPERFLGRDLRCTGCGSAFTSAIPTGEAILEPWRGATAPGWQRWLVVGALAVAAAVAVSGLALWLGGRQPENPERARALSLGDGSRPTHFAAFDRATMIELGRLLARPDGTGDPRLQQLLDGFRVIEVPSGTRVEMLTGGTGDAPIRVRLLNGRWAEKEVWVQASWVR